MIEHIVTSSTLIIMLLSLSALLEKKINPCLKYALWLLAALKLLVPLPQFPSPVSILNVVQKIEQTIAPSTAAGISDNTNMDPAVSAPAQDTGVHPDSSSQTSPGDSSQTISASSPDGAPAQILSESDIEQESPRRFLPLFTVLSSIWLFGAFACTFIFVWGNLRFARQLKKDRILTETTGAKLLPVYRTGSVTSPCLFGVFHPAVYLPEDIRLTDAQKTDILAHEYTHFRHGDTLWALVRCLCVGLYWYNPLVWIAARVCVRDSELACDYGALKRIGGENRIRYGKTLIAAAGALPASHIWNCSTQATGGRQEMKRRIEMIAKPPAAKKYHVFITLILCVSMAGCTFSGADAKKQTRNTLTAESTADSAQGRTEPEIAGSDPAGAASLDNNTSNSEIDSGEENPAGSDASQEDAAWNATESEEGILYNNVALYSEKKENQVCIELQPSIIRPSISYYYIPAGALQKQLTELVGSLKPEPESADFGWKGMRESGWKLHYQDLILTAFDGGYLHCLQEDPSTDSSVEYLVQDLQLFDMVQTTLAQTLDYRPFDITQIKEVTSAKLEMQNLFTGYERRSQTITDPETLRTLEDLFCNAAYIYGGAACGNEGACLELTLADGRTVRLSMSADSCTNYGINGVYYDYRPAEHRKDGSWQSSDFYQYFDQILPLLPL